jgi:hypothetical protein
VAGRDEIGFGTASEDARVEAAVLRRLLELFPEQLSVEELARELDFDPDSFEQRDAVERAVRELAASGLAHRSGAFAFPTRAALRFDQLLG